MKVLVVHGRYRSAAPSGENNVVDRESAALAAAGHVVESFGRGSDDIAGWSMSRKLGLPGRAVWNEEVRRELASLLAQSPPDVVHVHNTFPLLSPTVLHACRDAGVPVVATLHNYKLLCASGDFFRGGQPCHECAAGASVPALVHGCYRGSRTATVPVVPSNAVHRRAWRELVSAYVFISAAQRELLAGLDLPEERVFVKHNFVPEPPPGAARPGHLVAYVGRLDAAKGIPLLQAAWDRFRELHPASGLRLAVAGGGPLADEMARWAASRPSVDLHGLLTPVDAARLVARARAVVVPSAWEETFGLVAVEAMAAGVPPLAPAHGSFPELVTDGRDGVLFEPGDPDSLARGLADVDGRPEHFADLGRAARTTYVSRFQEAANVEQLVSVYRFAVEHPVGAARRGRSGARS
jgi:glycosyltransferase involved in cell wall biosynthesis